MELMMVRKNERIFCIQNMTARPEEFDKLIQDLSNTESDDELEDVEYPNVNMILTDGQFPYIVPKEEIEQDYDDVSEELKIHPFQTQIMMKLPEDKDEMEGHFFKMLEEANSINSLRIVPFEIQDANDSDIAEGGNVKSQYTDLSRANGFWSRAVCYLDSHVPEGDDQAEAVPIVRILLYGRIFIGPLEDGESSPEQIKGRYEVRPFFLDPEAVMDERHTISFDLVDMQQ